MALSSQKMNLNNIRTFVVLGQSNNMTEASKKLDVAISLVSRHLKQLEEELQTKLVVPTPKNQKLKLTDDGKYFFNKYEKIYNEIMLAEKEYKQTKQLDNCKLTIGVCNELQDSFIKPKLIQFSQKFPQVTIKIVNGTTEELTNKLFQYTVDLIVDKNKPYETKLVQYKTDELYKSNYCYVYNKDYFEDINDLNKVPFILPISNTNDRRIINDYFSKNNIKPFVKYELDNIKDIISYVKDGFGIGIVLKDSIKDIDCLSTIDIDIESDICVSYTEETLTPTTKEFLKLLK
ncbi:MAG: LysR family transcriptional regulator [Bacilli bacterium]|nr:LysR family transcriptional regulator [Bacilli bacterium]